MKRDDLYLIYEDTYIDHINEKVQLYSMVKQLCHTVKNLPSNCGSKDLSKIAAVFEKRSEEMFKSWNIPGSYLVFGEEDDLTDRIVEDLWVPEVLGYYHKDDLCDDCCPCGDDCPCCEEIDEAEKTDSGEADEADNEAVNDDEAADIKELFEGLLEAMQAVFGDKVTVHVFTE